MGDICRHKVNISLRFKFKFPFQGRPIHDKLSRSWVSKNSSLNSLNYNSKLYFSPWKQSITSPLQGMPSLLSIYNILSFWGSDRFNFFPLFWEFLGLDYVYIFNFIFIVLCYVFISCHLSLEDCNPPGSCVYVPVPYIPFLTWILVFRTKHLEEFASIADCRPCSLVFIIWFWCHEDNTWL